MWAPKYRKKILQGEVCKRLHEVLHEIALAYDIVIEELEVSVDHVHLFCSFCSFPPRLSISQVVTRFKASARVPFFRSTLKLNVNFGAASFGRTAISFALLEIKRQLKSSKNTFSITSKNETTRNLISRTYARIVGLDA